MCSNFSHTQTMLRIITNYNTAINKPHALLQVRRQVNQSVIFRFISHNRNVRNVSGFVDRVMSKQIFSTLSCDCLLCIVGSVICCTSGS